MSFIRLRGCTCAFKCILSMVWLVLFSEQLSYKFYQFSSTPKFRHPSGTPADQTGRERAHQSLTSLDHVSLNFHKRREISLSLDKRYNFKHIFSLPAPFAYKDPTPMEFRNELNVFPPGSTHHTPVFATALRGPPVL